MKKKLPVKPQKKNYKALWSEGEILNGQVDNNPNRNSIIISLNQIKGTAATSHTIANAKKSNRYPSTPPPHAQQIDKLESYKISIE